MNIQQRKYLIEKLREATTAKIRKLSKEKDTKAISAARKIIATHDKKTYLILRGKEQAIREAAATAKDKAFADDYDAALIVINKFIKTK